MARWYLWIGGTDEYTACDDASEVALTSLPAALQTVEATAWVQIPILALDPEREPWDDEAVAQAQVYTLQTDIYDFLTEMGLIEALDNMLNHRWLYLCMDGNGQSEDTKYPVRIHTSGKCIALHDERSWELEHSHDDGKKLKTFKFRKRKPVT